MSGKHKLSDIELPIDPYTSSPFDWRVPAPLASNEDDGDELSEQEQRELEKEREHFWRKDEEQWRKSRRNQ